MKRCVSMLIGAGLGLGGLATTPASAAGSDGSILVIVDISGSMNRKDATGTVLIEAARDAVKDLLSDLPDDANIGLRLYGHTYAGKDEAAGCRDTKLVVPIGPASMTGTKIQTAIDRAKPTGFTPIGGSLRAAADDFAPEGKRSIILVSDGEDTCGTPDPCAAAKDLADQDIDVKVDAIGLFLEGNQAAKRQLECVAKATGGSFYDVADADQLGQQLGSLGARAAQSFNVDGQEIDGGPAETQATAIKANTNYVDDVRQGEARWYSVKIPASKIPEVALTEDGSVAYGCCAHLNLHDLEHRRVGHHNGFNPTGSAKTYRAAAFRSADIEGEYHIEVRIDEKLTGDPMQGPLPFQFRVTLKDDPEATAAAPSAGPQPGAGDTESQTDEGGNGLLWALIGVLSLAVIGLGAGLAVMFKRMRSITGGS